MAAVDRRLVTSACQIAMARMPPATFNSNATVQSDTEQYYSFSPPTRQLVSDESNGSETPVRGSAGEKVFGELVSKKLCGRFGALRGGGARGAGKNKAGYAS